MKHIKTLIYLHCIILLYSFTSICSKFASKYPFLSLTWCAIYATMIFILGVYAILWQQILKKLPLNVAYANKSVTLAWGMIFGSLIFNEKITVTNVIGAIIVLIGVILMLTPQKTQNDPTIIKPYHDKDIESNGECND